MIYGDFAMSLDIVPAFT